jgi:urease accessory protein
MRNGEPSTQRIAALLQLASPMLPVGAFAYSQGLERAVHDGWIANAEDAGRWIADLLQGPMARFEAPVWLRLSRACVANDRIAFASWNDRYLASRETAELRAETLQMGASLAALARDLRIDTGQRLDVSNRITFPAAFAVVALHFDLGERDGLVAYLWSWAENQVAAALKAVPLGQLAGQRILLELQRAVTDAIDVACELDDDDLASAAPGLALASALHESQYSRLFRS